MNQFNNLCNLMKWMALAVLMSIVIFGCSSGMPEQSAPEEEYPKQSVSVEENPTGEIVIDDEMGKIPPVIQENPEENPSGTGEVALSPGPNGGETRPTLNPDNYDAVLEVTKEIRMGTSGTLSVWIGLEEYILKQSPNTERDTTPLYSIRPYARITPHAPDFKVDPIEAQCVKIDPTGSAVLFTLTPEKKGNFEVGAKIDLFDNEDCSGVPFPKNTQVVSVKVTVDYNSRLAEIWDVFWEGFLRFWKIFVALAFGALIFVIRKFVKKKTGYSEEGNEKTGEQEKRQDD